MSTQNALSTYSEVFGRVEKDAMAIGYETVAVTATAFALNSSGLLAGPLGQLGMVRPFAVALIGLGLADAVNRQFQFVGGFKNKTDAQASVDAALAASNAAKTEADAMAAAAKAKTKYTPSAPVPPSMWRFLDVQKDVMSIVYEAVVVGGVTVAVSQFGPLRGFVSTGSLGAVAATTLGGLVLADLVNRQMQWVPGYKLVPKPAGSA